MDQMISRIAYLSRPRLILPPTAPFPYPAFSRGSKKSNQSTMALKEG